MADMATLKALVDPEYWKSVGGRIGDLLNYDNLRAAGEVASMTPTPLGDVASGMLAVDDLRKGDYLVAAGNSVGLLPFVPSIAAGIKPTERLYHGSLGELIGELRAGKGKLGEGFYLTRSPEKAKIYPLSHAYRRGISPSNADVRVTEMDTSAKNWFDLDEYGGLPVQKIGKEYQDRLKELGFDGITIDNEVVIFDPKNVKKK